LVVQVEQRTSILISKQLGASAHSIQQLINCCKDWPHVTGLPLQWTVLPDEQVCCPPNVSSTHHPSQPFGQFVAGGQPAPK
jgi:hypothetical protein